MRPSVPVPIRRVAAARPNTGLTGTGVEVKAGPRARLYLKGHFWRSESASRSARANSCLANSALSFSPADRTLATHAMKAGAASSPVLLARHGLSPWIALSVSVLDRRPPADADQAFGGVDIHPTSGHRRRAMRDFAQRVLCQNLEPV